MTEQQKQTEKKEREFAEEVELTVTAVEVDTNPRKVDEVTKITIHANTGKITYKPITIEQTYRDGFKVNSPKYTLFNDLPFNLKEMTREISSNNAVKVIATYHIWNTKKDGLPATYKYIQGEKMMQKWKIIAHTVAVEKVA